MNQLQAYLRLVEHGRKSCHTISDSAPKASLLHLLNYAHHEALLPFDGPWRLDSESCRHLEEQTGYSPVGGWQKLAGLAAGCGVLTAKREGFCPGMSVDALKKIDESLVRTQLIEAFTRYLVPPGAAASALLSAGIHPVWGLQLAQSVGPGKKQNSTPSHEVPLNWLESCVFGAIACIIATLRKLDPRLVYPIGALSELIAECWNMAHLQLHKQLRHSLLSVQPSPVLDMFDDDEYSRANQRTFILTTTELVESVFVPAGAMRRFDDNTFCVVEGAFDAVMVATMDSCEQDEWLTVFLTGESLNLVA